MWNVEVLVGHGLVGQFKAGRCGDCVYARLLQSARGSVYCQCERSLIDDTFPKYPDLPLIVCKGYRSEVHVETRRESGARNGVGGIGRIEKALK